MNTKISLVNQKGAVLIVGLIFLVLMSIMGLTYLQNVTMQERLTGNTLNTFRATQEAETALLFAEKTVEDKDFITNSYYFNNDKADVDYLNKDLWQTCDDLSNDTSIAKNRRCQALGNGADAKFQQDKDDPDTFLITVSREGVGNSRVMLQTRYQGKIKEQK